MMRMTPMRPEYRHILTGRFEKEKMASNASKNNLRKFIFASPFERSGLEYSTKPCLNPIKDLSPGRYLFFSVRLRKASSAFFDIMEKFPTCLIFFKLDRFRNTK